MTNLKNLRNFLAPFLLGGGIVIAGDRVYETTTWGMKQEVKNLATEIRTAQEISMGIDHFDLPKFSFVKTDLLYTGLAGYNTESNEMTFVGLGENRIELLSDIAHELGHDYVAKLLKKLGTNSLYALPRDQRSQGQILISEAIAEYFRIKTFSKYHFDDLNEKNFEHYDFKHHVEEAYGIGPSLVDPILNRRINFGIELLAENPPTSEDLKDLKNYQEKILKMMGEK